MKRNTIRFHRGTRAVSAAVLGSLLALGNVMASEDDYQLGSHGEVLDDRVLYSVGGGSVVGAPSSRYQPGGIGASLGWRANLQCGQMNLETTLQNQLNGVTAGFQQIMGDIVQNATQAVMSLPALIIQRANPGLYELLSNGVMQGRIDFDRSKLTCQSMAEKMMEKIGPAGWGAVAKQQQMQSELEHSEGDAVTAVNTTETQNGNQGLTWVGGQLAGGQGQSPIQVTQDVVSAGFNLLHNRPVRDTSAISPDACQGAAICSTWPFPQAASDWAVRTLGESQVTTCDGCESLRATAGVGLTPDIQHTYTEHLQALRALLTGATAINADSLGQASSPLLPVTRGVIEALREDPDQELLARRLASETALSSVFNKALQLQRLLLAGSQEPNVNAAEPAQAALARAREQLEAELHNLEREMRIRRLLANNTASRVLERQETTAAASRAVQQNDPEPQRLDKANNPTDATP